MCLTQMTIPIEIGALLAKAGDLTLRELSRASAWQRTNGGTIERALLATGAMTEEFLTDALARSYGLPGVSRATLAAADPGIVASLPLLERRRFRALPFALLGRRLRVATCDPRNSLLRKNLSAATGFDVEFHVAPEPVLADLIAGFEGQSTAPGTSPSPEFDGPPAAAVPPEASISRIGRALRSWAGAPEGPFKRGLEHLPRFDASCHHIKAAHFALCPRCGDVL